MRIHLLAPTLTFLALSIIVNAFLFEIFLVLSAEYVIFILSAAINWGLFVGIYSTITHVTADDRQPRRLSTGSQDSLR